MTIPRTEKLYPGKAVNLERTSLFYNLDNQDNEPMQLYSNLKNDTAYMGTKSGRTGQNIVAYN